MKSIFLLFLTILIFNSGFSQNLIFNCSFEDLDTTCSWLSGKTYEVANGVQSVKCIKPWGDLSNANIRANPLLAKSGNVAGELIVYDHFSADSRTYLQAQLPYPLKFGETYHFSMYIRINENSRFTTSSIGVAFTSKPMAVRGDKQLLQISPTLLNHKKEFIPTGEWMLMEGSFVALGIENFIQIGNFSNDKQTRRKKNKSGNSEIVLALVDDIRLFSVNDTVECCNMIKLPPPVFEKFVYTLPEIVYKGPFFPGKIYILNEVFFPAGRHNLIKKSYPQLDSMVNFMQENLEYDVEIIGHTDDIGDFFENYSLSIDRAFSIKYYLMGQGISTQRIVSSGFGSTRPVVSNETTEGRAQNRRVEVIFKIKN
jgi:OmpA-OmpF porin, OOP family